ncbi:hypothetical protein [Pseudomonas sp.]|uniref:hypothetical protein n=1 Tax=Pseudomonas sp. TaxID=306 RepID=UPI0035638141
MTNGSNAVALITMLTSLSACTSQKLFSNEIYLFNNCGQTLQVVVAHDSNIDLPERTLTVLPGGRELIGLYRASQKEDVIGQIQDAYELRISGRNGASLQVNARTLKTHLQHVEKIEKGVARQWVIENPLFCPGKGTSVP